MSGEPSGFRRLTVAHEAGQRYRVATRQHSFAVDQLPSDGGEDTAPMPTELFIGSLASCVAIYAANYLARHGFSTDDVAVTADYRMASAPYRVGEIVLRLEVPGLPADLQPTLLAAASRCAIHNTLLNPPSVRIELAAPAAAGAAARRTAP
ncbi:MAG TPA: OsmC family protein [Candidatus Binatia bacterium]|nr:OsmC family protein [Candidatus Binatia bacterium]